MTTTEILARSRDFLSAHKVTVTGQGTMPVVLANGFGTDQGAWRRVLPWLERHYRVVRFDWVIDPQHYDSTRYATLHGYADDLLALLMALDLPRCHLIGHSMGGMSGMLAARRAPERFGRMVMLSPSPCFMNRPGYVGGFEAEQIDALLRDLSTDYLSWATTFSPLAMAAAPDRPEVAEFTRSLLAMRPDVAFSMALAIFKMDLRDQLDGFTTPTTIVQTRNDIAVPMAVAEYLRDRWPHSRLEIIDTEGHFPHLTAPAQLIAILGRSLAGNEG